MEGPVLVHVRTQKGRGYEPAIADQVSFHGAALPPMTVIEGGANGQGQAVSAAAQAEGDATPSSEQVEVVQVEAAELHDGHGQRADRARARPTRASWPSPPACPPAPGCRASRRSSRPDVRRRHRRAARDDAGHRSRARRHAPIRGHLLDVPAARVRPDRARRLPERRAGGDRRRPGRPGRRGRHQPPGHVHHPRPAPAAQPDRGFAQGRAGAAPTAAHGVRPGPPVRAALPARLGPRPAGCRPNTDPGRQGRGPARGQRTCSSSASGRS